MTYDDAFFENIAAGSSASAAVIAPRFCELVRPLTVVDVGCGKGWFAAAFAACGVPHVLGIDGGPPTDLAIPEDQYRQVDLTQPFELGRRFDLAVCLEVAEHLPEAAAAGFVGELCNVAPAVLFSAAIPMQGGEGHINERWPDYWAALFADHRYKGCGWPRIDLWGDERVEPWYRQNLLFFLSDDVDDERLRGYVDSGPPFAMYRLVHPAQYGNKLGVKFL